MSRKIAEKRRELLNDPNWTEEFPKQINAHMVHDGFAKFCPCGHYHPTWAFEPDRYEIHRASKYSDQVFYSHMVICPETGREYENFGIPLNVGGQKEWFSCIEFIGVN